MLVEVAIIGWTSDFDGNGRFWCDRGHGIALNGQKLGRGSDHYREQSLMVIRMVQITGFFFLFFLDIVNDHGFKAQRDQGPTKVLY